MRLALHENLLARGAAFRCAPVFACSVILDVLNPKMFVKTCVFRHSFSCHFFFCVVFKEHFASIFSAWLRCCSKTLVRVARYAFLAFPSLRLAIRKISSQNPSGRLRSSKLSPFGLRYTLKTNQCSAKCLDSEICSEVSLASCLLRKEVIQPHLPIRLPCYDFTPVIAPTFDGFPPASGVNDFRGVTGGVYKARERIHRSMLTCDY